MNGIYIRKTFCVISLLNLGREVFLKIIKRICLLYIGAVYRVYALMRWYLFTVIKKGEVMLYGV